MNILWSLFIFCFGLLSGALIWQNYEIKSETIIVEKTEIETILHSFKKNNHKLLIELFDKNNTLPKFKIRYINKLVDEKLKHKTIRLLELFSETEIPLYIESNVIKKDDLKLKIITNNNEYVYYINEDKINTNIATKNFLKLFQIYSLNS